jgi:hypothetical protein
MSGIEGGGALDFADAHAGHWSHGSVERSSPGSVAAGSSTVDSRALQQLAVAQSSASPAPAVSLTAATAVRASAIAWQQQLSGIQIASAAARRRCGAVRRTGPL